MYNKEYYESHKEARKASVKAWRQSHKEEAKATSKEYYQAHKEEIIAKSKAYYQEHKEQYKAYQKAYHKAYHKADVNVLGQTKGSIRSKSQNYLKKYGKKIEGYQIHHCCTYTEPYKFIYCNKEMHKLIHAYLRQHNIDADSDHYDYIKHLLDESVVLYGLER